MTSFSKKDVLERAKHTFETETGRTWANIFPNCEAEETPATGPTELEAAGYLARAERELQSAVGGNVAGISDSEQDYVKAKSNRFGGENRESLDKIDRPAGRGLAAKDEAGSFEETDTKAPEAVKLGYFGFGGKSS